MKPEELTLEDIKNVCAIECGIDRFVALATRMAELVDYDSGYASLSLNWSVDSRLSEAAGIIVPIALRHPGYDVF